MSDEKNDKSNKTVSVAEVERLTDALVVRLVQKAQAVIAGHDANKQIDRLSEGASIKNMVEILALNPLDKYERTEARALIDYVAKEKKLCPEMLCDKVLLQFDVAQIADIQRAQFQKVRAYLIDMLDLGDA